MSTEQFVSNPYKKEDKKTLGEVVISQIDVCRKEFSKELKKGFQQQMIMGGKVITVNVPDQRNTNIQCTKTLHDLMMFFFDKDFKTKIKEIKEKLNKSGEKYFKVYLKSEHNPRFKKIAEETEMIQNTSIGEKTFQALMNYQSEIYRELFQELVLLFKRRNELSGKRLLSWDDK